MAGVLSVCTRIPPMRRLRDHIAPTGDQNNAINIKCMRLSHSLFRMHLHRPTLVRNACGKAGEPISEPRIGAESGRFRAGAVPRPCIAARHHQARRAIKRTGMTLAPQAGPRGRGRGCNRARARFRTSETVRFRRRARACSWNGAGTRKRHTHAHACTRATEHACSCVRGRPREQPPLPPLSSHLSPSRRPALDHTIASYP